MQLILSAVTIASVFLSIAGGALAAPVERRAGANENDLVRGNGCKDVTVIFARGTTEAGNVGSVAGPPLFRQLRSALGNDAVAIQGVEYAANVAGFLQGGDKKGSQTMANLVTQAATDCPNTKIVMSGYSQGAQLVHNAAALLPANVAAKVNSVVMFGDPKEGDALKGIAANKVNTICHFGDNICDGGSLILTPHLTYGIDANRASNFIESKL